MSDTMTQAERDAAFEDEMNEQLAPDVGFLIFKPDGTVEDVITKIAVG